MTIKKPVNHGKDYMSGDKTPPLTTQLLMEKEVYPDIAPMNLQGLISMLC